MDENVKICLLQAYGQEEVPWYEPTSMTDCRGSIQNLRHLINLSRLFRQRILWQSLARFKNMKKKAVESNSVGAGSMAAILSRGFMDLLALFKVSKWKNLNPKVRASEQYCAHDGHMVEHALLSTKQAEKSSWAHWSLFFKYRKRGETRVLLLLLGGGRKQNCILKAEGSTVLSPASWERERITKGNPHERWSIFQQYNANRVVRYSTEGAQVDYSWNKTGLHCGNGADVALTFLHNQPLQTTPTWNLWHVWDRPTLVF